MTDFFVSYAREDGEFARALVARLTELRGDVWFDEKDLPPSIAWLAEVQRAIEESIMMVAIVSDDWLASASCSIEVGVAERGRVPIVRVGVDLDRVDEIADSIIDQYQSLPRRRLLAVDAAAAGAIWLDAGRRRRSLLLRGRALRDMRRARRAFPDEFSPTATKFIAASRQASVRRWVLAVFLGVLAPVLVIGTYVSLEVTRQVNERAATNIATATQAANAKTFSNWNTYAGLERARSDVADSFMSYYQLFSFLTDRTPTSWDANATPTPVVVSATSPDGSLLAEIDGAQIVVTGSDGSVTRLLASGPVVSVAWSGDSRWVAASTAVGADVISVLNGRVIPLRGGVVPTAGVHWVDGQRVAVDTAQGTGTWTIFDGEPVARLDGVRFAVTVDDALYSVDAGGMLSVTALGSGLSQPVLADVPAGALPTAIDVSGGEVVVAFSSNPSWLRVLDIATLTTRDVAIPGCAPLGLSISPDGSAAYVACSQFASNHTRVDLRTGEVLSQPAQRSHAYGVRALEDRILWGSYNGSVDQTALDLSSESVATFAVACGAPIRKFVGSASGETFFPIGDASAAPACTMRMTITDGSFDVDRFILPPGDGHAMPDAAVSADGSLVAYGLSDGSVRVFTTDGLHPIYFAQVLPDQVRAVSFSADGTGIVVAGLNGDVVEIPLPFTTADAGATALFDEAIQRLDRSVEWGLFAPTR